MPALITCYAPHTQPFLVVAATQLDAVSYCHRHDYCIMAISEVAPCVAAYLIASEGARHAYSVKEVQALQGDYPHVRDRADADAQQARHVRASKHKHASR